jgi:hypothetical protein
MLLARGQARDQTRDHVLAHDQARDQTRDHVLARDQARDQTRDHLLARDQARDQTRDHMLARDQARDQTRDHVLARDQTRDQGNGECNGLTQLGIFLHGHIVKVRAYLQVTPCSSSPPFWEQHAGRIKMIVRILGAPNQLPSDWIKLKLFTITKTDSTHGKLQNPFHMWFPLRSGIGLFAFPQQLFVYEYRGSYYVNTHMVGDLRFEALLV